MAKKKTNKKKIKTKAQKNKQKHKAKTQKTRDLAISITPKIMGELMCSGILRTYCSTSDTYCVTPVNNPMIRL